MNDLIEKLKQNEKPFGLNTKEERECFEEVGYKNCTACLGTKEIAFEPMEEDDVFYAFRTYRISPSYQPEPEVERCEVDEVTENGKGVLMYFRGTDQKYLTNALNDPDYIEPLDKDGNAMKGLRYRSEWGIEGKPAAWPKYVVFRNRGTEAK